MLPIAIGKILLEVAGPVIASKISAKIAASPVAKNELNQEKPYQSRVVAGSTLGVTASVGIVLVQLGTKDFPNYDWEVFIPALLGVAGAAYALYGRLKGGLKPLFSKGG